jgi:hypothetical protein
MIFGGSFNSELEEKLLKKFGTKTSLFKTPVGIQLTPFMIM